VGAVRNQDVVVLVGAGAPGCLQVQRSGLSGIAASLVWSQRCHHSRRCCTRLCCC
jgi:hypothetical protein